MDFRGAPVTKGLVIVITGTTCLLQGSRGLRRALPRAVESLSQMFIFKHLGELVFGSILVYFFRIFERQLGSERYGALVGLSLGASHMLQQGLGRQSGPHALIAANLINFIFDIPPTQQFTVFGINLTNKVFIYSAVLQLILSSYRQSWPSFMIGAAVGLAYHANLFGIRKLKVPDRVSWLLGKTVGRVLGGSERKRIIMTMQQSQTAAGVPGRPASAAQRNAAQAVSRQVTAPSPEALAQLVAMGFEEQRASNALQQANNDVQTALALLL